MPGRQTLYCHNCLPRPGFAFSHQRGLVSLRSQPYLFCPTLPSPSFSSLLRQVLCSPGWPSLLCRGWPWKFDLPEGVQDWTYSTSKFNVVLGSNKCCASVLNNWASVFILAIQWFLIVGFNLHFLMADGVQDFVWLVAICIFSGEILFKLLAYFLKFFVCL